MGRDLGPLPKGWENPIPDAIWPDALISALRVDVAALASPRVIETLRKWRDEAGDGSEPRRQREARERLRAVGEALLPREASAVVETDALARLVDFDVDRLASILPSEGDRNDAFTVDSFRSPPLSSSGTRVGDLVESSRSGQPDGGAHLIEGDAALPSREFSEEDENPTALRSGVEDPPLSAPRGLYRAARIDPFAEEDEKPTASIPIPDEIGRRARMSDDARTHVPRPDVDHGERTVSPQRGSTDPDPPRAGEERTVAAGTPPARPQTSKPTSKPISAPSPSFDREVDGGDSKGQPRLAPKPGIVRRRALSRQKPSPRPRAAMQQVRLLHNLIRPLCDELIPLSVERRSRRFWARWREVAGDRGVRREFVEEVLSLAQDATTLVSELIAEAQSVDVRSAYALVEKIESEQAQPPAKPLGTPERQRGPLVGASVRVEGSAKETEEES